jgi:hypothetical protein
MTSPDTPSGSGQATAADSLIPDARPITEADALRERMDRAFKVADGVIKRVAAVDLADPNATPDSVNAIGVALLQIRSILDPGGK